MWSQVIHSCIFSVFLLLSASVYAREFAVQNTLNPGNVLSSDVLNEIFKDYSYSNINIVEDDLIGEWECDAFAAYDEGYASILDAGWQANGVIYSLDNATITFSKNGDTYSLTTSFPTPISLVDTATTNSEYLIRSNILYFFSPSDSPPVGYMLRMLSETRILMLAVLASSPYIYGNLLCDRLNLPPINPKQLTASLSTATVSLAWQDASDDETSFKILRKDSLTGDYAEIGTASKNATTYTDTLSTEGKYWYRVMAVNENGDSVGSNVVKVTYGDDTESLKNELRMLRERIQTIEEEL